jgi:hypothetical protein
MEVRVGLMMILLDVSGKVLGGKLEEREVQWMRGEKRGI